MAVLRFHYDVYSKNAIEAAIEAFGEVASSELKDAAPYFEVELSPKEDADEAELIGEFGNYVLASTIDEKRAG